VEYEAFAGTIAAESARLPMRVLAYCLMPNRFHLVLRSYADGGGWHWWLVHPRPGR
jgi:putative transposase